MTYVLNIYDVSENQILTQTLRNINDLEELLQRAKDEVEHFRIIYGTEFLLHSLLHLGGVK